MYAALFGIRKNVKSGKQNVKIRGKKNCAPLAQSA